MTHTPNTESFGLTPKALAYILNSCCVSLIPNFNMANLLNFKKSFTRSYKQELWKDKKQLGIEKHAGVIVMLALVRSVNCERSRNM